MVLQQLGHSRPGPGIPIVCFVGIDCESPQPACRDFRVALRLPETDPVSGVGFLSLFAGLRLGQGGGFGLHVPITRFNPQPYLERCRGALHEAHEKHQHRIDPAIERRRGHYSVGCGSCSCHAGHYRSATSPADLAPLFPPKFSGKSLKSRPKFFEFPPNANNGFPPKAAPVRGRRVGRSRRG